MEAGSVEGGEEGEERELASRLGSTSVPSDSKACRYGPGRKEDRREESERKRAR